MNAQTRRDIHDVIDAVFDYIETVVKRVDNRTDRIIILPICKYLRVKFGLPSKDNSP